MNHYIMCKPHPVKNYISKCDCSARKRRDVLQKKIGSTLLDAYTVDNKYGTTVYEQWIAGKEIYCTETFMSKSVKPSFIDFCSFEVFSTGSA